MSKKVKRKTNRKKHSNRKADIQSFKKEVETDNHKIPIEDLLNRLGTDQHLVIVSKLDCSLYHINHTNVLGTFAFGSKIAA